MIRMANEKAERNNKVESLIASLRVPAGLSPEEAGKYSEITPPVPYIYNTLFSSPQAEDKLFGQQAGPTVTPVWTEYVEAADDAEAPPPRRRNLTLAQEQQLFLQLNYARYRLSKLAIMQARRVSLVRARAMLLWHARACTARDSLVTANMALVLSMARKIYFSKVDFAELVSEGNMALLRCVEKFNVAKGYRFSTYTCGSILRVLGRLAGKVGRYRHYFPTEFDPEFEQGDQNQFKQDQQWGESVDALAQVWASNAAGLSTTERRVISERFALASRTQGRTLGEVGKMMGLSNERVRQIQNAAMDKIRAAIEN